MRLFSSSLLSGNLLSGNLLSIGVLTVVSALSAELVSAQIRLPGQTSPFPGGGSGNPNDPNGPNGGGRGNGRGRGGGGGIPGLGGRSKKGKDAKDDALPTITTTGILRLVSGTQLVLEADDHRIIAFNTSERMRVLNQSKPVELSSFSKGDHLTIDATQDDEGYFSATEITFSSAATPSDRAQAGRTFDLPDLRPAKSSAKSGSSGKTNAADTEDRPHMRRSDDRSDTQTASAKAGDNRDKAEEPAPEADDNRPKTQMRPADAPDDADDSGRPQLRRGAPAPRATANRTEVPPTPTSASTPKQETITYQERPVQPKAAVPDGVIPVEEDATIVKAKSANADFAGTLPNFLVKQSVTRYESDNPKSGWEAHDIVTADITAKDGTQEYTNVKVGSRSVKSMADTGGVWSTGEFSTWVEDVFNPSTAARFRRSGQETINGRPSVVFKYDVTRENSHWRVTAAGQLYYPAYRGTIWIDRESARVLRLEVEARAIPLLFPYDKVEMATDYDFVRLAAVKPFLLPTTAEVLNCQHATSRCYRNKIEFRNYRKFGAESDITFEDKQ